MKLFIFIVLCYFLPLQTLYASQKQVEELASIISTPLGYLDKNSVSDISQKYLKEHSNLYALKITELLTQEVYLSVYKENDIFIPSRYFPSTIKKQTLFSTYVTFNGDIVGKIELYGQNAISVHLSKKEKQYLENKKSIITCIDPNWMPFESLHDYEHIGISADFMSLFSKTLNTPILNIPTFSWKDSLKKVKNHECDILPLASKTKQRSKYLNFTTPYISIPAVIVTSLGVPFITNLDQLKNKPFGIVEGYSLINKLLLKYPDLSIVKVSSIQEGLKKVQKGELFGYIDNSISIHHQIQENYLGELTISGKLDIQWDLSIATRNDEPELLSIFQKLIDNTDKTTYNNIVNKWYTIQNSFNYQLLIKISLGFLFIIIFILFWIKKLKQLNNSLEIRVQQALKENQETERLLMQKSKLADMGEMIRNIAHQWRQPLATSNMAVSILKTKNEMDQLEKHYVEEKLTEIEDIHLHMSKTIEDFLSFFNPNKTQETFNLLKIVQNTLALLKITLTKNSITLDMKIDPTLCVYGYKDEYAQVILAIITNAIQAYKPDQEKKLTIKAYEQKETINLEIKDNAGGIDDTIINKIFDPYFTTKHPSHGTGLGLYIAKMIIEKNMHGSLLVQNIDGGALFSIITTKEKEK